MKVPAKLTITGQTFLLHERGCEGRAGCLGPFIKEGTQGRGGGARTSLAAARHVPPPPELSAGSQPGAPEATWGPRTQRHPHSPHLGGTELGTHPAPGTKGLLLKTAFPP